jgi:hypothetical protein
VIGSRVSFVELVWVVVAYGLACFAVGLILAPLLFEMAGRALRWMLRRSR